AATGGCSPTTTARSRTTPSGASAAGSRCRVHVACNRGTTPMTARTRFRTWLLAALGAVLGLILLLVLVGMFLPREHTARASIELAASPERVWAVVSDF